MKYGLAVAILLLTACGGNKEIASKNETEEMADNSLTRAATGDDPVIEAEQSGLLDLLDQGDPTACGDDVIKKLVKESVKPKRTKFRHIFLNMGFTDDADAVFNDESWDKAWAVEGEVDTITLADFNPTTKAMTCRGIFNNGVGQIPLSYTLQPTVDKSDFVYNVSGPALSDLGQFKIAESLARTVAIRSAEGVE